MQNKPRTEVEMTVKITQTGCTVSTPTPVKSDYSYRTLMGRIIDDNGVLVETNFPEGTIEYRTNLISFLHVAWSKHYGIELTPDMFWYTILCSLSDTIKKNAETYRHLFTTSSEKKNIITVTGDPTKIDLNQVIGELDHVMPNNSGIFLPIFSTSSTISQLAFKAAFCDAVSPYYNYMTTLCGIPYVKLLGEKEDWVKLHDSLITVAEFVKSCDPKYADWAVNKCAPILNKLAEQFDAPDEKFMRDMFEIERCGSGHVAPIKGWIVDVFYDAPTGRYKEVHDFNSHISIVKYANMETGRKFNTKYGLMSVTATSDGGIIPVFCSVIVEVNGED